MAETTVRCDLHVHSVHSGRVNLPVLKSLANDSYSDPMEVSETARRRGMDLVTLTDHDTIAGCLAIAHLPGTFVSEEVTVELPGRRQLHVNVFGIDEARHERIARLRFDPPAFFAYLHEEAIAASANHLFSGVTGPRACADILLALQGLSLIEERNGMMPSAINAWAARAGAAHRLAPVGGSDGHTLATVARAWTAAACPPEPAAFLAAVRAGAGQVGGTHGGYWRTTFDVLQNFGFAWRELLPKACCTPADAARLLAVAGLTLAMPVAPLVTAALFVRELLFAHRFGRQWLGATDAATVVASEAWPRRSTTSA
jgi:predicted metal-dependent phosphoesterase TrpH